MASTDPKHLSPEDYADKRDALAQAMYAADTGGNGVLSRETAPVLNRFHGLAAAAMRHEGYVLVRPVRVPIVTDVEAAVLAEREACAALVLARGNHDLSHAIRERGSGKERPPPP